MSGASLADQQVEIRDLVIGPGTSYCWAGEVPDWWGYSSVRTQDTPRSASHGIRGGRDLLNAKVVTGQVLAQAADQATLLGLIDAFMGNWTPSPTNVSLRANLLASTRLRMGRPRRALPQPRLTTRFAPKHYASLITFQFDALDPLIYSDALHSAATGPPGAGTGVTLPVTFPFTIPAGSSSGIMAITNGGTMPTRWTARMNGPLVNPAIRHDESGSLMQFNASGGLTINAGDYVLLDSSRRSVLYNGTADRRLTLLLGSGWFDLLPGQNTVHFAADSGAGTITLEWRDAYQ